MAKTLFPKLPTPMHKPLGGTPVSKQAQTIPVEIKRQGVKPTTK